MLHDDANRKQEQAEYLGRVQALGQAIASAISAIEKYDRTRFEAHLAVQETICNRLTATNWKVLFEGTAPSLIEEVRQAHMALAQLNRVYAALLKRVRRSSGLIVALYRSHGEGYDRGPSPLLSQGHTWSCEA